MSCFSASSALQHGGFVPRERLAAFNVSLIFIDVDNSILAEHMMTRRMADGRVIEETTYVIDPNSSESDNDSSDDNSGGEDVGEGSDEDDGGDHEREGDDETMVITFEESGDHNDDHDEEDEDDDDDDDDDSDDDHEGEIDTVPRPEGLYTSVIACPVRGAVLQICCL